jgi:hypothetical protein
VKAVSDRLRRVSIRTWLAVFTVGMVAIAAWFLI